MATIDSVKLPDNSTYDLTDNYSGYQKQTLTAPISVDGASETTVEGALGAVNDYADKIKGSMSNENLLDNPFFTVNQRGASSYSTAVNYTANRWYMPFGGLTVGISSSGATLTATGDTVLDQKFETDELKGKTVTLSIMHFDGTIEQGTVQFPSTVGTAPVVITGGELQAGVDTYGNCYFRIVILTGNTITARAVKLELGSVSTLANDVAPDYALELAKCRASTADPSDTYANKGNLVNYADLTTIHATGSTNTTGAQIDAGTFFYLNGQYCKAITNIANGATFTLNTNFEVTSVGKELKDALDYSGTYIFNGTPAYEGYGGIIVPASLPIPASLLSEYNITVTEMSIGRSNGANISLTIDSRDKYEKNHGGVQAVYTLQNYFGTTSPAFANFAALRDAYATILVKLTVAHV